jgi:hypothetical protein
MAHDPADLQFWEAAKAVHWVNNLGTDLGNADWETVEIAQNYEIIAD